MTPSLLDRQLATITDILRQREANLQHLANKRAKVMRTGRHEGSENAASVTASAVCEDSERTVSVSQLEVMHTKQHGMSSGRDADDIDDPKRVLRELGENSQKRHAEKENHGFDDSKHVDIPRLGPAISQYGAVGVDRKEKLQELNRWYWATKASGTGHNETSHLTGSKFMLTDNKEERQAPGLDAYQGTESDLEMAFGRSTTTLSCFYSLAPQHTLRASGPMPASYAAPTTCRHSGPPVTDALDPETIPYAVALILESAGCKWEEIMGWALYLFSSGMEAYRAKQEMEQRAQEKETLDAIMARVLADEEKRRAVEKKPFASRVLLSNLAADVDQKSIYQFFSRYQRDIRDITLLPGRDPVKRTRTAYVDMTSRTAAVCASLEFGYIFGLKVESKLAVE